MTTEEKFIEIYNKNITRKGAAELLKWLRTTDFFTAPASTKYHGAYQGGLVDHSLNVYRIFKSEMIERAKMFSGQELKPEDEESAAVCALLHDVCKVNYYAVEYKNVKSAKGTWEKVPYFKVANQFPYGHGEKSVWLIQRFMRLSVEESIAIRWHMGGFDDAVKGGSYDLNTAYEKYPAALLLHIADMKATYMLDK